MKKKLMIVRPSMGYGGADRVTLVLLENLPKDKYDITLVLMRAEGEYMVMLPSHVKLMDCASRNLLFFLFPLRRIIREEKPDTVFSTCGGANMPLALIAFLNPFRNWRVILSERNILFPPGKSKLKRVLMLMVKALFYRFADTITAVSLGVKKELHKKLFLPNRNIFVVHNPVIDQRLLTECKVKPAHPWFEFPREIPVILHVGRFVPQKDHATLLGAFKQVRSKMPARLFLLGEGPLKSEVMYLAESLGLKEDIIFGGFDINPFQYMANCDAFILSSLHEGMPGVLIQAMACGAVVVSTDCPSGPDEIISAPGKNGFLVPVRNVAALSEKILLVLNMDKEAGNLLAEEGRKAVQRFHVKEAMQSYLEVIEME